MYLQDVDDVYDLQWAPGVLYRDVRHEEEYQLSRYSFELADVDLLPRALREARSPEGWRAARRSRAAAPCLAAYDWCLKARTPSTCSTRAAPSRSASARA